MGVMSKPMLALASAGGVLVYLGLAILGWGGFDAFFANPARTALVIVTAALVVAALFTSGNLSSGEREDRSNRWVISALGLIGLLSAWLPAYTDRKEFWTLDGDGVRWIGVALYAGGGTLRFWPVFVLGRRSAAWLPSSPGIRWSRVASSAPSAIPAISVCSFCRWVGRLLSVQESVCCSRRSIFRRSLRAFVRKRHCCARSSAKNTKPT